MLGAQMQSQIANKDQDSKMIAYVLGEGCISRDTKGRMSSAREKVLF
jgi:hypothetical protein